MNLLLQPGELLRVVEYAPADRGAVNHAAGFDGGAPSVTKRRDHRLTVEQIVHDPVSRDRRGTNAPEGFERGRLAGGNAAGQPDR
jgi:hypothetical protein